MTNFHLNQISAEIVDSCFHVHRELGPGLLESAYQYALLKEFELRDIKAIPGVPVHLYYKGYDTGKYFTIDLLVENEIIVEIKSAEHMYPVYIAQVISYLKLSHKKLGLLVNFNVPLIRDGIKRLVNNF